MAIRRNRTILHAIFFVWRLVSSHVYRSRLSSKKRNGDAIAHHAGFHKQSRSLVEV